MAHLDVYIYMLTSKIDAVLCTYNFQTSSTAARMLVVQDVEVGKTSTSVGLVSKVFHPIRNS